MLSKAAVKARPSVLWCYKKELGFSRYFTNMRKCYIHVIYIYNCESIIIDNMVIQSQEKTHEADAEED